MWKLSFSLVVLATLIYSSCGLKVHPESITVPEGQGFIFRLDDNGSPLKSCQLSRNAYKTDIGDSLKPLRIPSGELVQPVDDVCGVRVQEVNSESNGDWVLSALTTNGDEVSGFIKVTVLKKEIPAEEHCPDCPQPLKYTKTKSIILECPVPIKGVIKRCLVDHRSLDQQIDIIEGRQYDRYSAYLSDFQSTICQFEIPHPVLEKELGLWTMDVVTEINLGDDPEYAPLKGVYGSRFPQQNRTTNCRFIVRESEEAGRARLDERTKSNLVFNTVLYKTRVACAENVYYKLSLCYLVHSSGEVIFNGDRTALDIGNCFFEVQPGNYTCGFNGPTPDEEDVMQRFQVIRHKSQLINEQWRVNEDGSTTLECHWLEKRPVNQCFFVSPSGEIYRLTSDKFKSDRFSYYNGGSMKNGDCGITFAPGVAVEENSWSCMVLDSFNTKHVTEIRIRK